MSWHYCPSLSAPRASGRAAADPVEVLEVAADLRRDESPEEPELEILLTDTVPELELEDSELDYSDTEPLVLTGAEDEAGDQ